MINQPYDLVSLYKLKHLRHNQIKKYVLIIIFNMYTLIIYF
jgi:hypothetical protein